MYFRAAGSKYPALIARAAEYGGLHNLKFEERQVDILDARLRPLRTLSTAGFEQHEWHGLDSAALRLALDSGNVTQLYEDVRRLIQDRTRADKVIVLGHRRRIRAQTQLAIQPELPPRPPLLGPSLFVHVDYSPSCTSH